MALTLEQQLNEVNNRTRVKGFVNIQGQYINPERIVRITAAMSDHNTNIKITVFLDCGEKNEREKFFYTKSAAEYEQFLSDVGAVTAERLAGGQKPRSSNQSWEQRTAQASEAGPSKAA